MTYQAAGISLIKPENHTKKPWRRQGHQYKLEFKPSGVREKTKSKNKPRIRKILWYNPPYHILAVTQMGTVFKEAMEKHIKREHPLWKILNPHTAKCSYATMPSMASKIGSANNRVEMKNNKVEDRTCSCPKTRGGKPTTCEWGGKCLLEGVIYKCEGRREGENQTKWEYIGETGGNIKKRISTHMSTFKIRAATPQTQITG